MTADRTCKMISCLIYKCKTYLGTAAGLNEAEGRKDLFYRKKQDHQRDYRNWGLPCTVGSSHSPARRGCIVFTVVGWWSGKMNVRRDKSATGFHTRPGCWPGYRAPSCFRHLLKLCRLAARAINPFATAHRCHLAPSIIGICRSYWVTRGWLSC
jgi:hypothetical protein